MLAVAENRLSTDLIEKRLFSGLKIVPEDIYVYPPSRGTFRLRETLATYAAKTFMKASRASICCSVAAHLFIEAACSQRAKC